MTKMVDTRGLPCPQPVILTRKALAEVDEVTVIVDNETAKMNVSRMAAKAGCRVEVEEKADGIYLRLIKTGEAPQEKPVAAPAAGPTVLFVSAWAVGRGPEELQDVLIRSFFPTLKEVSPLPDTIIFINTGVKLTVKDSPVLEDLQTLEERGVKILICGTCLNYFGLKEKVAVGTVSNMYTIAEELLGAGKVVAV
ncbi:MAG: sulfurtransferase-like selenium metabolism protein YedF [Dehalococcoidia bacterium]